MACPSGLWAKHVVNPSSDRNGIGHRSPYVVLPGQRDVETKNTSPHVAHTFSTRSPSATSFRTWWSHDATVIDCLPVGTRPLPRNVAADEKTCESNHAGALARKAWFSAQPRSAQTSRAVSLRLTLCVDGYESRAPFLEENGHFVNKSQTSRKPHGYLPKPPRSVVRYRLRPLQRTRSGQTSRNLPVGLGCLA